MTESEPGPGTYRQELSRSLSLLENIFLTLSSVSPAGSVFIYAPVLIASLGGASVMAMVIAAAVATCVAMCYAELATMYPIAGGEYTWAARVLGRPVGFGLFLLILIAGPGVGALLAAGAGEYLTVVWPALPRIGTAVALIVFATTIATLNVRANSWITGGFLALELLVLVALTALGLMHPTRGMNVFLSPQVVSSSGVLAAVQWDSITPLVPVALLMLGGYQNVVYFAEETAGTTRNLGRAVLVSLAAVVALQLVPLGAVIVGAGSLPDLMTASAPISAFARERGGRSVSTAMSLGIALAIVNALIVAINVWARILFASARDRSWPNPVDRWLATVHERFRTPVPATMVIGAAAVAASFLPFGWLLTTTAEIGILQMGIVGVSATRARWLRRTSRSGYRMPVWPVPALALILVALGLLHQASQNNPSAVAISLATVMVGIVYYYGFIHPRRRERWTLPLAIHEDGQ